MGSAAMPWEKYGAQPSAAPAPWEKYSGEASQPESAAKPEAGLLDRDIPLTSHTNATLSGLQSVGRGVRGAGEGILNTILHPIDTAKSMAELPSQAAQVPAAIHDINQSEDPTGTYAKIGQETAGQGAGQALTALATEGIAKAAGTIKGGDVLAKGKAVGKVAGQEAISRVPVVGRIVRRPSIGDYVDAIRTKTPEPALPPDGMTPIQRAWVARGGKLVGHEIERYPRVAPSATGTEVPMRIAPEISFPPEEPTPRIQLGRPKANPRADFEDDLGVQQDMRNYLDKQDRSVHAFEPIGAPKGAINEEFNAKIGKPSPPVKYTKMPSAKASSRIQNSVEATPADADLTPEWQAELDRIKARKAKKGGR